MLTSNDHAFAICAYEKSLYLEESIESLLSQTVLSKVIICTSTPNEYIAGIADKYSLPLYIREGDPNIAEDWNFAIDCALGVEEKSLVTIAHQDDIYLPIYTETMIDSINAAETPLIFFSDYAEIRGEDLIDENKLLSVKRIMLAPLRIRSLWKSRIARRRILSFGSAICCPSVTFCLGNLKLPIFQKGMRSNLDWQAWERISNEDGSFVYAPKILMLHRIHRESETSKAMVDSTRETEDLYMYEKFWPTPIAKLLNSGYAAGRSSNEF